MAAGARRAAPAGPLTLAGTPQEAARRGWFDRLIDGLAVVAGAMLCALTVLICVDVAGRKPGLFTIPWTLDVAEYTLYIVTFCGAPWVLREGGHISIDLFVERLRPALRHRVALVSHGVGALVSGILLYYSCRVWWVSFSEGVLVHETFVFPEWLLMSLAPPVFLILLVMFVRFITGASARPGDGFKTDGL